MSVPQGYEVVVIIAFSLLPAAVPIVIAYVRRTTNRTAVLLISLLTSWTCIGWAIAVAMATTGKPEALDAEAGDLSQP